MNDCFFCSSPKAGEWGYEELEYVKNNFSLCVDHTVKLEEKMALLKDVAPKKYELKTGPAPLLPPIVKKQERSFYERETGEEG